MKYAIISDIHANLEALQAVIEDAASLTDSFVCLGDIVGYNANPIECVQIIRDLVPGDRRWQSRPCGGWLAPV